MISDTLHKNGPSDISGQCSSRSENLINPILQENWQCSLIIRMCGCEGSSGAKLTVYTSSIRTTFALPGTYDMLHQANDLLCCLWFTLWFFINIILLFLQYTWNYIIIRIWQYLQKNNILELNITYTKCTTCWYSRNHLPFNAPQHASVMIFVYTFVKICKYMYNADTF